MTGCKFLELSSVSLQYDVGEFRIDDISLSLQEGELACILGPSGCGKSTLLRAIAGFQPIEQGQITLGGKSLSTPTHQVDPEQRGIGMVFQDHALFPHLTVAQNVGFGLHRLNAAEKQARITDWLEVVGLSDHAQQYPHELSGGQSQRVALARTLAPQPRLVLLDEPFSNLDTDLRGALGLEVRSLLKQVNTTAIMVTHDQHDAFALGDQIAVMRAGRLEQTDTPYNLYHAPANRFVAKFVGEGVFVQATVSREASLITGFGELQGAIIGDVKSDQACEVLIRPDDVSIDSKSPIRGRIDRKTFQGAQTLYSVALESGDALLALAPSHLDYEVDDEIGVALNTEHLVCF